MDSGITLLNTDLPYPRALICGIMGPPNVGKTLYALQQGFAVTAQVSGNILYIKTEEGDEENLFINLWAPKLAATYKSTAQVIPIFVPDVEALLAYIGVNSEVIRGEKNELKVLEIKTKQSKLWADIERHKIVYLVVDSVTTPFDVLIAGGRQNLPLRAQAEEIFFHQLNAVIAEKKVYVMTTNHISLNPTDPYKSREKILLKGGKIIAHYTKILLYLDYQMKPHGYRRLWVVRFPTLPEWQIYYDVLITNEGFKRATSQEIAQLKKAAKGEEAVE